MALDYAALAAELTAGHPVTGAYNVSDQLAADELNTVNRPANNTVTAILEYLVTRNHRTQQGTDSTFTPILSRLHHVANSAVGDNPFDREIATVPQLLTLSHIHSARFFIMLFDNDHLTSVDYNDANMPFGQVNGAGVWSTDHATAMKALSDDRINRAEELGFGIIRTADVTEARAI